MNVPWSVLASNAFRDLQRFGNIRFRRYFTQRRKGRGFGWKRYPNRTLYAMGIPYIGSGKLEYLTIPICAWWTVKTVGLPYSGKLNVQWEEM